MESPPDDPLAELHVDVAGSAEELEAQWHAQLSSLSAAGQQQQQAGQPVPAAVQLEEPSVQETFEAQLANNVPAHWRSSTPMPALVHRRLDTFWMTVLDNAAAEPALQEPEKKDTSGTAYIVYRPAGSPTALVSQKFSLQDKYKFATDGRKGSGTGWVLDKRLLCSVLRPAEIIKDPKTGKDKTEKATGSNIKAEDKEKKKKYICDVLQGHPVVWQLTKSTRASSSNRRAAEAPPHHEQAAQRPRTSSPNAQQSAQQNVASTSMPQPNLPAPLSLQVATATASDIAAAAAAAAAQMVQDATSSSQQQPNAPAPLSAQAAATASNVAAAAAVQSTQFSPDAEQLLGTLLSPQGVDLSSPAGRELALPQLREGLDRVADLLDVRLSCGPRQPHKDVPGLVVQGVVGLGHCVVAPCRRAAEEGMSVVDEAMVPEEWQIIVLHELRERLGPSGFHQLLLQRDERGNTPLHWVCRWRRMTVFTWLLGEVPQQLTTTQGLPQPHTPSKEMLLSYSESLYHPLHSIIREAGELRSKQQLSEPEAALLAHLFEAAKLYMRCLAQCIGRAEAQKHLTHHGMNKHWAKFQCTQCLIDVCRSIGYADPVPAKSKGELMAELQDALGKLSMQQ